MSEKEAETEADAESKAETEAETEVETGGGTEAETQAETEAEKGPGHQEVEKFSEDEKGNFSPRYLGAYLEATENSTYVEKALTGWMLGMCMGIVLMKALKVAAATIGLCCILALIGHVTHAVTLDWRNVIAQIMTMPSKLPMKDNMKQLVVSASKKHMLLGIAALLGAFAGALFA